MHSTCTARPFIIDLVIFSFGEGLTKGEARMADRRGVYGVFVGRPDGKKPLGRPKHRWEDNI